MSSPPVLDDRTQEELLADLTDRADGYIDDWDGSSTDTATVLLRIFSEFGSDLIQRLNDLPRKHRAAFLELLGIQRRPPQAARLPLSIEVSTDLDRNVTVPGGTQAVAETSEGETELFEIPQGAGFEATPASLADLRTVDPDADRIVTHEVAMDGDSQMLFAGANQQQHALYLGDDSLLTIESGSVLEISLDGSVDPQALDGSVVWEFYGVCDETEGWHELPAAEESAASEGEEPLDARLERLSTAPTQSTTGDDYSVRLRLPGELVSTSVNGIESRWVRCRLTESTPACFATEIGSVQARVGQSTETDRMAPDAGFANDVPLSLDDDSDIRPFGRLPQPSSTMYLAANDALTKPGAVVTFTFHQSSTDEETTAAESATSDDAHPEADFGALSGPPEISWEYWNGTGWAGLDVQLDGTDGLRTAGDLQIVVPDDIEELAVSGLEARWIRGRLVSGSYGQPAVEMTDPDSTGVETADGPRYSSISVRYEHTHTSFTHAVAQNNGVFETLSAADRYRPFTGLPETNQTIYFGFDAVLRNGPVPIFVSLAETSYPQGFDPGLQWEYCTDPATDSWSRLPVEDGTGGLTERGIVSLQFPEPTTAHERFGTRCHWIRAVVTEDSFAPESSAQPSTRSDTGNESASSEVQPPVLSGLYPNTQWADNARTVEGEILGASDGSADQRFECAHGPIIDCEIWVDEAGSLSASERAELREADSDRVERVTDDHGDLTEFWVRWSAVDDFTADRDGRVYRCDRTAGTVTFGDGDSGKIPPRGQNAIRATYTTGGGEGGNVEAGAITDLKTPISLVESVDNPLPADGGAGVEPLEAVESRAASRIRTRGKAVTASDYEHVAATAVRKLATVDCQPQLGPEGGRRPGWITLLIVPDTDRKRPTASMELKQRVTQAVTEAAPATLTAGEGSRITVRGPRYAAVSVDVTLSASRVRSISTLKAEIESTLASYLHPLTGGTDGTGWAFGELPTTGSIRSQLTAIEGVDGIAELSSTVRIGDEAQRLTQRPSSSTLPADGLVCDGSHDITVQVGDRQ